MSCKPFAVALLSLPSALWAAQPKPELQAAWYALHLEMESSGRTYLEHLCIQKNGKLWLRQSAQASAPKSSPAKKTDLRGEWRLQNGQLRMWHDEGDFLFQITLRYQNPPAWPHQSYWLGHMAFGPGAGKLDAENVETAGIWDLPHGKPPRYVTHSARLSFVRTECPPQQ
ncbi:hypothetical protein V8J88_18245 [Massilia sp. W12]|uniref:hypothetical protein n=1 Tax=Massilia sp. W12 TaxID=3126507 RepID=UPI0030D24FDE